MKSQEIRFGSHTVELSFLLRCRLHTWLNAARSSTNLQQRLPSARDSVFKVTVLWHWKTVYYNHTKLNHAFRIWSRGRLSWLKFLRGFPEAFQINAGTLYKAVKWNRILCWSCTLVYIALIVFALNPRNGCTIEHWVFPQVCMNPSNGAYLIFPNLWGFSECCRKKLTWHDIVSKQTNAHVRLKATDACSLSC